MAKSNKIRAIVTLTILGLFFTCASLANFTLVNDVEQNAITPKSSGYWDLTGTLISIDNNWSLTELTYAWCTGGGTENDPYLIENVTLDAQGVGNCISIQNSIDYFEIRNCTLFGAPDSEAAIWLESVENGKVTHNNISNNIFYGIRLLYCENITMSYNVMSHNDFMCVSSWDSDRLVIKENNMTYQDYGLFTTNDNYDDITNNRIFNSDSNSINLNDNTFANVSKNIIHASHDRTGIRLGRCNHSIISENRIKNGFDGLYIWGHYNNITNNVLTNNSYGLKVIASFYSNITGNTITNNSYGIFVDRPGNTFYLNYFNNAINVFENPPSGVNYWDNGSIGNYYSDYGGKDANDDGIGDVPHAIPGTGGSQDNYPIWWDAPVLSVNTPLEGQVYYYGPPDFNVEIDEGVADAMWYTLGSSLHKYFFVANGTIDSTAWDNLGEGSVDIKFFANDSEGFLTSEEVSVTKTYPTPPTSFILDSDAGTPDDDGDFTLTWTESTYATNYSVYQFDKYITEINGSLTLLEQETTDRFLSLSGFANGDFYFIVVSYNIFGTNISDCVKVEVNIPDPIVPDPAIPSYNAWFVVALSGVSLLAVAFYRRKTRIVK